MTTITEKVAHVLAAPQDRQRRRAPAMLPSPAKCGRGFWICNEELLHERRSCH